MNQHFTSPMTATAIKANCRLVIVSIAGKRQLTIRTNNEALGKSDDNPRAKLLLLHKFEAEYFVVRFRKVS